MLHKLSVKLARLACAGGVSLLVTGWAAAQCAMCRATVAGDPRAASAAHQMNLAVLLLLIPATALFCGFFVAIVHYRNSLASAAPAGPLRPVENDEFDAGPLTDYGENLGPGGF